MSRATPDLDPTPASPAWHTLSAARACRELGVDAERGLADAEVAARRAEHGPNVLASRGPRRWWRIYVDQLRDFMIVVLIGAAIVSGVIGELADALVIVVIILLNALVGFVQEYRAERAVAALRSIVVPKTGVRRCGESRSLPAADLVPGDVVLLEAGQMVPADLRLLEAVELRVDESALTGESSPVDKHSAELADALLPVADRTNTGFKGTLVTHGRGVGVVVSTGMRTEFGRIAALLDEGGLTKTPLQRRLAQFGRRLTVALLAVCAIVFVAGLLRSEPVVLMLLTAVSLAVAAIPEALPAVVTIALAQGARRMADHRALVRHLPAVETLGSVTTICSDKTGTLTRNEMVAERFWAGGEERTDLPSGGEVPEPWISLARGLALNNDTVVDENGALLGDPTETALFAVVRGAECDSDRQARIGEVPFDSRRKRMTTVHADGGAVFSITKGAPESIVPLCRDALTKSGVVPLDRAAVDARIAAMASDGYRVLAFAQRTWEAAPEIDADSLETELTFLGLVGLVDPPREEAAESIALCRAAGIVPVMITGDHPQTAAAIARRLGIADSSDAVVSGRDLAADSGAPIDADTRVFARVSPEQKIQIVERLQARGEVVAMTGDGINDAPALRRADIGVAMGIKGTDVSREAAKMILLDDNFATIVRAVREGRRIYDNIRKFLKYTMTSNSGEIWTVFLAPFLGLPLPLLPIHILWINLVTDGLPGLALSAEGEEPGLMRRPPRPRDESVFAHGAGQHMIWCGLLIGLLSLGAQAWAIGVGSQNWQTIVFTVLTLSQLVHALAIRSERASLFSIGVFSNPLLLGAILLTVVLQAVIVYVPFFGRLFATTPLTAGEVGVCLTLPWIVLVAVEIEKMAARRGWIYRGSPLASG